MTHERLADNPPPPSLRARIADLGVGESLAEVQRLQIAATDETGIETETEKLRNRINPNVARAKAQTGGTYTVENGSFLTRSRDLVLVFAVTRTA